MKLSVYLNQPELFELPVTYMIASGADAGGCADGAIAPPISQVGKVRPDNDFLRPAKMNLKPYVCSPPNILARHRSSVKSNIKTENKVV